MNQITEPLRLAVGSHEAGSGMGCAMNVISWENGDRQITDMPGCADPLLAQVVQQVNDTICTHRTGKLLCPACSLDVLALAHRTVGTALDGWSDADRKRLYVRLALDEAMSVARPDDHDDHPSVVRCRETVQAWLDGKATGEECRVAAAYAAAAATYAADVYTANAAVDSANASYFAYAATNAAYANAASRLERAHQLITRFERYTGITAPAPDPQRTRSALAAMSSTR